LFAGNGRVAARPLNTLVRYPATSIAPDRFPSRPSFAARARSSRLLFPSSALRAGAHAGSTWGDGLQGAVIHPRSRTG